MINQEDIHAEAQRRREHSVFILFFLRVIQCLQASVRGMSAKRFFWIGFAVFSVILLLSVVFFCRKPVIVVSDKAFTEIYGQRRELSRRINVSLKLFRPVKTISISQGAGPDLAAQGAISLSSRPYAVFFPFRYREGALRYQKSKPGSTVVILAGRKEPDISGYPSAEGIDSQNSSPLSAKPLWFYTDLETDLYRAGLIAGSFIRHGGQNPDNGRIWGDIYRQEIAVFLDGLTGKEKSAFQAGLEEQQWGGTPFFLSDSTEGDLACAVIAKDFQAFGEEKSDSLILFTWMDPALTPKRTLAIFDDSPWAQICPVMGLIKKGDTIALIPSEIIVKGGDKALKQVYNEINTIKTVKKTGENADN